MQKTEAKRYYLLYAAGAMTTGGTTFARSVSRSGSIGEAALRTGTFGRTMAFSGGLSLGLAESTRHNRALGYTGTIGEAVGKVGIYSRRLVRAGQISVQLLREGEAAGDSLEWTFVSLKARAAALVAAVLHLPRSSTAARRDGLE